MRKRSKKRIPQEQLPWVRVNLKLEDENSIKIYHKKTSRWISGNRRDKQTQLFNYQIQNEVSKILISSYLNTSTVDNNIFMYNTQLYKKIATNSYKNGIYKPKNFCLFLGKGRTYNRKYFISRQILRKLVKTGLISGLQKK